jgi:hypothetical protein
VRRPESASFSHGTSASTTPARRLQIPAVRGSGLLAEGCGTPEPFPATEVSSVTHFSKEGRDGDEQSAYSVAAWLQRADQNGSLERFLKPSLTPEEHGGASVEGWVLGVV